MASQPMTAERSAETAYDLLREGREEEALAGLSGALGRWPERAELWQAQALCFRAAQELGKAMQAFARAAQLAPSDTKIAHGLAQCRFEAGQGAAADFQRALSLAPGDLGIAQGLLAAIAAEEGPEAALLRLGPMLRARPEWLAGHWLGSRLAVAAGHDVPVDQTIAAEVARSPSRIELWRHWLFTLMQSRRWEQARSVAAQAQERFPGDPTLKWTEAAAASEQGEVAAAEVLFSQLGPIPDITNAIYRCRQWLRLGQPEHVAAIYDLLSSPAGAEPLIPYFGLAWRLLDHQRWRWLEQPSLIGVYDIAEQLPDLDALSAHLRGLHNQVKQPLEQSVRNGTQTDGNLLLREDPIIKQLRACLTSVVERHVAALPPVDPHHPQLRHRRDRPIRYAGSWSVRLTGGGHHEQHVHPFGWFSSALYVALPAAIGGERKAGWLTLGQPQDSLELGLAPTRMVEPKPGRLVLFPSTMWHGTIPFDAGERLTCAFDVQVPA